MKVYIIAEAAVSHEGSVEVAEKMIEAAFAAGADCVKFQAFIPHQTAMRDTDVAASLTQSVFDKELIDILLHSYFGKTELAYLKQVCKDTGIDFLCSAFEEENLDWLADIGETRVKIPSCRNTNRKFLQIACAYFDKIFISTGMMTEEDIDDLWIKGASNTKRIKLLHCISAYPCPYEQINLGVLKTGRYAGLSDHTFGWEVPVAAVALGAQIIEKHFTLTRTDKSDDCVSLEPDEFADMVRRIRNVELAMGDGVKKIMPCEEKLLWRKAKQ